MIKNGEKIVKQLKAHIKFLGFSIMMLGAVSPTLVHAQDAEEVEVVTKDGTMSFRGTLVSHENGFFILETTSGPIKLSTEIAKCVGKACPKPKELLWGYQGEKGPENWSKISPEFATCRNGQSQSPVDLAGAFEAETPDAEMFWNSNASWVAKDNGHTIAVKSEDGGRIKIDEQEYTLLEVHFHDPSEHALKGIKAPMEAHFVHKSDEGAIAVIGVMMVGGGENSFFDNIMNSVGDSQDDVDVGVLDPNLLFPGSGSFFRYSGSLTTPPCTESVLWTVMEKPVLVSNASIAAFGEKFEMNARPLQKINRRFILTE